MRHGRARSTSGDSFAMAWCGRGTVVWRPGRYRVIGGPYDRTAELARAVAALFELEGVDLRDRGQVIGALSTIAGARLLRGRPVPFGDPTPTRSA